MKRACFLGLLTGALLLLCHFSSSAQTSAPTPCINAINTEAMTQAMLARERAWLSAQPVAVVVLPFSHDVDVPDPILRDIFPVALRYLLQGTTPLAVASPFLVHDALARQPILANNTFDVSLGVALARALGAKFAVIGKVDRYQEEIRVYARLIETASGTDRWEKTPEFHAETNNRFFTLLEEMAHQVLAATHQEGPWHLPTAKLFGSFEALTTLTQGTQHQKSYQTAELELARAHFTRTTATYYDSYPGYLELARTHFQLALATEAQGLDASLAAGEAKRAYDRALGLRQKLGLSIGLFGVDRFLAGQGALQAGLALTKAGKQSEAARELSYALALLPESPLALSAFGQLVTQPPNVSFPAVTSEGEFQNALPPPSEALRLAHGMNACLGPAP